MVLLPSRRTGPQYLHPQQDKQGNTALHLAVSSHSDKALPHLLAMPGAREAALVTNKSQQTALHLAAGKGSTRDILLLLDVYPAAKDMEDRFGRIPLQWAIRQGHQVVLHPKTFPNQSRDRGYKAGLVLEGVIAGFLLEASLLLLLYAI